VQLDRIDDLAGLRRAFVDAGVWIRPIGDVLYLTPALTIGDDDLDELTAAIVFLLRQRRW